MADLPSPLLWVAVAVVIAVTVVLAARFLFPPPPESVEDRLARELAEQPGGPPRPTPQELVGKVHARLIAELQALDIDPRDPTSELLIRGALEQLLDEHPLLAGDERAEIVAGVQKLLASAGEAG